MTLEDKLSMLQAGLGVIAGLTSTKRDDQALDVVSAVRAAVGVVNAGLAGTLEHDEVIRRLEAVDGLVAADDADAMRRLRDRFDVSEDG